MPYIPGDPWVICDRSGFKVRRSQTKKTWDGYLVWKKYWYPEHPQDHIRAVPDRQAVKGGRSEPDPVYLAVNEVTEDSL